MPTLSFCGQNFRVIDRTALSWPTRNALIVADLHLEKASWFAAHGQMLPPHDSRATIERLARAIESAGAREVWCIGDNFHDDDGAVRLPNDARALLSDLTNRLDWHWIVGNHDEHLPKSVGGTILTEAAVNGVILRHRADPREAEPELSGHFHPKHRAGLKGRRISRPCFVASDRKMILPSFGALTGGLAADHPEIIAAVGRDVEAMLVSGTRLLRFQL